jgi:hypothetical protein
VQKTNIGNLNKIFRYKTVAGHIQPFKGKKSLKYKNYLKMFFLTSAMNIRSVKELPTLLEN